VFDFGFLGCVAERCREVATSHAINCAAAGVWRSVAIEQCEFWRCLLQFFFVEDNDLATVHFDRQLCVGGAFL
jgi:hypothetical protein